MEQIPVFTIREPIFKSACDFYLFYKPELIIPKHKDFNGAHESDGQVVRKSDGENHFILWVSNGASDGTLEHECIHLAACALDHVSAFPGDADEVEPMIRLFDYYLAAARKHI